MSVFVQARTSDAGGNLLLTVPQGRTWKVMAIGISVTPNSEIRLFFDHPIVNTFYARETSTETGEYFAAIGAPQDGWNDLLPDISLPSGSVINVQLPPGEQPVALLIED